MAATQKHTTNPAGCAEVREITNDEGLVWLESLFAAEREAELAFADAEDDPQTPPGLRHVFHVRGDKSQEQVLRLAGIICRIPASGLVGALAQLSVITDLETMSIDGLEYGLNAMAAQQSIGRVMTTLVGRGTPFLQPHVDVFTLDPMAIQASWRAFSSASHTP